jgi:ataxia telangiectasia mutated family protein
LGYASSITGSFLWQEFSLLNEQNVVLIPEAIFSLCAAFSSLPINSSDILQRFGDCKIYSKVCY